MRKQLHNSMKLRSLGLSLVELLVAMVIGVILIFGATQIYVDSRNSYDVNESTSRLQETARYALSVLETDIRHANYWGLTEGNDMVDGRAEQNAASVGEPTNCGNNFARDLMTYVESSNNAYSLACNAYGANGAVTSADTITVRHASTNPSPNPAILNPNFIQICSTLQRAWIAGGGETCPDTNGMLSNLVVNTYYVSRDSIQAVGMPSLRRKVLESGLNFADVEIIPGIEDLQVQFGIETAPGPQLTGAAERYVNQVTPAMFRNGTQVVSVRVWLMVRAEQPEVGFTDNRVYEYADRHNANGSTDDLSDDDTATLAYAPADNFRRLLVTRTIMLRNRIGD